MTQYEQQQIQQAFYSEDRSAVRWPYYAHLTGWLLLFLIGIWMTSVNPGMSFVLAAGYIGLIFTIVLMAKNWPTGIRIDSDGIRIGGLRSHPRLRKNLPWADWQRRHVFFCPWDAVRSATVITDKPALRDTRRLTNRETIRIGALTGPFTKAALLIEVDLDQVTMPEFREPDTGRQMWRYSHLAAVEKSPVWYVPTRHPEALRAALAQHAGSFGGNPDPHLRPSLRSLFERAG